MGDWIEQLLMAQNQTNSKLSQLIIILEKMTNVTNGVRYDQVEGRTGSTKNLVRISKNIHIF